MKVKELLSAVKDLCPVTEKGKVVALENEDEERVPLPEGVEGYVDQHPEGADRGGYVPVLEISETGKKVFYSDVACEWQVF